METSAIRRCHGWVFCATMLAASWLLGVPAAAAGSPGSDAPHEAIVVFAASSMTNALQDIGAAYQRSSGTPITLSFAASSALARQIESGAPADLFVSADVDWMDYLASHRMIDTRSRRDIVGNQLVLIAPAASTIHLKIARGFALMAALGGGRLATGDPGSVPVGRYAHEALAALDVWESVAPHIAGAENVRAALALVDRGEAPLGIVYRTDALVDKGVRIIDVFPADSHSPIVYPAALTVGAKAGAARFLDYLRSPAAGEVFFRYGFTVLH